MMRMRMRTNWYVLRDEVESALRVCGEFPASVTIDGRLNRLEAGLSHQNFWFRIKADGSVPHVGDTAYVLRKLATDTEGPSHEEAVTHLEREAMILQALASQEFDFSVPRFVCFVHDAQGTANGLIETALDGPSLDGVKKDPERRRFVRDTIARIAGAVHRVSLDTFGFLPRQQDSRAHLLTRLDAFDPEFIGHDSDAAAVAGWVRDHLPENRPAVLLHGDLLPQNVLRDWSTDHVGVIDWEFAMIGDAAYDLAIVTRGRWKVFGAPNGLRRFVEAYRRDGGGPIEAADVVNHELLLVLRWLEESICAEREKRREGQPPAHWRRQIRAILDRARSR